MCRTPVRACFSSADAVRDGRQGGERMQGETMRGNFTNHVWRVDLALRVQGAHRLTGA